jgi:hypothetical protein
MSYIPSSPPNLRCISAAHLPSHISHTMFLTFFSLVLFCWSQCFLVVLIIFYLYHFPKSPSIPRFWHRLRQAGHYTPILSSIHPLRFISPFPSHSSLPRPSIPLLAVPPNCSIPACMLPASCCKSSAKRLNPFTDPCSLYPYRRYYCSINPS